MNYEINHKTFILAFKKLTDHNKHHKTFKVDKRLTLTEKKIIESLLYLRKNDFNSGIDLLLTLPPMNAFVDGIKELCISHFYNNSGRLKDAQSHFILSCELLSSTSTPQFEFLSQVGNLICHFNLKDYKVVQEIFESMDRKKLKTESMQANYLQCKSLYQISINKNKQAANTIDKIFKKYPDAVENRKGYFLTIKLMALFNCQELDLFAATLDEYKKLSGFKIKENYRYMHTLFKFIYNDAPIYVYERDFESVPILFHELNVINSLEQNETQEAITSWNKLKDLRSQLYGENFQFLGDLCLFSKALQKVNKSRSSKDKTMSLEELSKIKKIKAKIVYILTYLERPVSKEELIYFLWQEDLTEKSHIRLTTQISRLRKDSEVEIKVKNGNYFIDKAS
jgi:hypothetical protein